MLGNGIFWRILKQDWERFKGEFLFDVPESKSYDIIHEYVIDDITIPKEYENDPIMARKMAVRKGILKRKIDTGSGVVEKEYPLEA